MNTLKHKLDVFRVDGRGKVVKKRACPVPPPRVEHTQLELLDVGKISRISGELRKEFMKIGDPDFLDEQVHFVEK